MWPRSSEPSHEPAIAHQVEPGTKGSVCDVATSALSTSTFDGYLGGDSVDDKGGVFSLDAVSANLGRKMAATQGCGGRGGDMRARSRL